MHNVLVSTRILAFKSGQIPGNTDCMIKNGKKIRDIRTSINVFMLIEALSRNCFATQPDSTNVNEKTFKQLDQRIRQLYTVCLTPLLESPATLENKLIRLHFIVLLEDIAQ